MNIYTYIHKFEKTPIHRQLLPNHYRVFPVVYQRQLAQLFLNIKFVVDWVFKRNKFKHVRVCVRAHACIDMNSLSHTHAQNRKICIVTVTEKRDPVPSHDAISMAYLTRSVFTCITNKSHCAQIKIYPIRLHCLQSSVQA